MRTFASWALIIFGLLAIVFGTYLLSEHYTPKRLTFENFQTSSKALGADSLPYRITIPSLNLDLGVFPAKIANKKWEATTKGISYLNESPIPGEKGNSILYGHNFPSILGNLTKAKKGEKIEIEFSDKSRKTFTIEYTSIIAPNQTYVLKQSKDRRITLYTCTGFLDSKRFVVTAILD